MNQANALVYVSFKPPQYFLNSLRGKYGRSTKAQAFDQSCIDMQTGKKVFAEDVQRVKWKDLIPVDCYPDRGPHSGIDDLWETLEECDEYKTLQLFKKLAVFAKEYFNGEHSIGSSNSFEWGCHLALQWSGGSHWTDCGMEYDVTLRLLGVADIHTVKYYEPDEYLEREHIILTLGRSFLEEKDKLAEARKNLEYDPEKVDTGIRLAQWKEWAGETVTLGPEETQWVYQQLRKLCP